MNHQDIVARIRNGRDTSTPQAIFAILLDIIRALPANEHGGLLRKDAGENIIFYTPANCNVSISRVCYPDGVLAKVFTDSGPGGANGPAWNDDGSVETFRYIRVVDAGQEAPGPTPADPELKARVGVLEATVTNQATLIRECLDKIRAMAGEASRLESRVATLELQPAPEAQPPAPFVLPALVAVGKVPFIGTIKLPVVRA